MATVNVNLTCDLQHPVQVQYIGGNMFSQDNAGNTINVDVFNDGEPATMGGSISANVIRADGATVAVSGALSGNRAYVILPQACYAVPGTITVIIKNTESSTVTTIAAFVANVYQSSTDTVVDPGTIIPSVASLVEAIEDAVESIPADYSDLLATLAADYSTSKTYKVGDYAWYGGVLKRCIVPITTAESYTAAHWTNAVLGDDVSALKSALDAVINLGSTSVFATDFEQGYRHERSNCALVVNANYVITRQPIQFYAGQVVTMASGYGLQFLIIDANPSNNGAYVCTRRSTPYTITADIQAYIEVRYEAASTAISASTAEEKVTITTYYPIVKTASDAYNRAMKIIKYVATTGNDTNDGNSSSTPYKTIGKALTELADEIYIKPGTYVENLGEVNTGYRYRKVKIVGDHVILQSTATLHFRFCDVEIVGIYFDHQATSGEVAALQLYNCTGRVADCVADGCPGNGFRFDGSRLTVERCIAMNCGIDGFNGHTLTTGYETEVTLIDCIAHDCGDDGASIHEAGKMYVIGGEYYNNVQTGLAPHDLCEFEALNVHCHDNGIGIEAVKDTLSEGQTPAVGRVIGCILNNNDTYGLDVKNYTVNTLGNGYADNGSGNTNAGTGATINAFVAS